MKLRSYLATGLSTLVLAPALAADVTTGTTTPPVGEGVQNLTFSTSSADLTAHSFVAGDYIASDVNGGESLAVGQSFTTGSNAGGYLLNSISVRQVSWGPTNWDFDGGELSLRVVQITGSNGQVDSGTELVSEFVSLADSTPTTVAGTPAEPVWVTFELATPLSLDAETQYAFFFKSNATIDGATNNFLVELDGTNTDAYAGGTSLTVPDGGEDFWRGGSGSDRAFVANMSLPTELSFAQQPQDYTGFVGDTVTLNSSAVGDPAPTYQWEFSVSGSAPWSPIGGATTKTLTLDPVSYSDFGYYRVVATSGGMSLTSDEVLVDLIYPDPVITQQPASMSVLDGGTATFTVVAEGLGTLSYQWFAFDGSDEIPLVDGGKISGAETATLQIAGAGPEDEAIYFVEVSDDAAVADEGSATSIFSDDAMLTIAPLLVTLGTDVPAVGDGVQNLNFSSDAATGTQLQFVPSDYIGGQFRGDDLQMGQSFTTGPDAGYLLNSISVRQVAWGPTSWDYDGGTITLRIIDLSLTGPGPVWNGIEVVSQVSGIPPATASIENDTPAAPMWLTFELAEPVALDPNKLYAFAIGASGGSANDEFFMELDGTATDSYAGGFALSVPESGTDMFDGNNGRPSDRAFVANMTSTGPGNTFASWIANYPGVGAESGFEDDPDGDGLSNGEESFFGTDPTAFSAGVVNARRVGDSLVFEHPQSATPASDVTAAYRWSTDLAAWNADGATAGGTTVSFAPSFDDPAAGTTTVTATISGTVPDRLFVDLEITQSAP